MQATEVDLNAIALIFTLFLGLLILTVPRRLILSPFLLGGIVLPLGLTLVVGSLHLFMFRILLVFAWLRVFGSAHFKLGRLHVLDKLVLLFVATEVFAYTLLWQSGAAFVNRLGLAFNAIGAYFFFRHVITDMAQVHRTLKVLASIAGLIAVCAIIEQTTTRNLFSLFGGVSAFSEIRDGRLRCQGPFAHSILAGTFGATLFPIFVSMWWQAKGKLWAVLGSSASVVIVVVSSSSGPVLTLLAAVTALLMWPLRAYMRFIRWAIVAALAGLQLIMNGPVWALIGRASVFGSSSSDHRYELVDNFIRNVGEWWLLGLKSTAHWGWGMQDVSNNYVRVGIDSGFFGLLVFILIIVFSFKALGKGIRISTEDRGTKRCLWGLGASLFSHLVAFMGVSYWDQIILIWYFLLAIIASLTAPFVVRSIAPKIEPPRVSLPEWQPSTSGSELATGGSYR
jgi:hypothetical protein